MQYGGIRTLSDFEKIKYIIKQWKIELYIVN